MQNPPSIPTLTVVRIACWLRQAAFVIDWHNFGFTLLALSLGSSHPFVRIHSWYIAFSPVGEVKVLLVCCSSNMLEMHRYERRYGKMADGYLCVTRAMQHELEQNWGIRCVHTIHMHQVFYEVVDTCLLVFSNFPIYLSEKGCLMQGHCCV